MAITRSLLCERRNPFLLSLTFLLVSFLAIIFFTTDNFNRFSSFYYFSSDLKSSRSIPSSPQSKSILYPPPNPRNSSASYASNDASKQDERGEEKGINEDDEDVTEEFDFRWEICGSGKGSEAADNIPCLDNMKAIKALKSRKRMEHRERHCPKPSQKCLVSLPVGYKIPVPWPKSRDMVRWMVRVHWDGDGGKPLIELNRILRPGGLFVWSATPVYRDDPRDQSVWNAMVTLTESICWRVVAKAADATGIGLVMYQKPTSNSCYEERKVYNPHLCIQKNRSNISWYTPLEDCLPPVHIANSDAQQTWPISWPERLNVGPSNIFESNIEYGEERFYEDMKHWEKLVSGVYMLDLAINWSGIRNVMDMNAGFGGFAAALAKEPLWVMNVVPIHGLNTLPVIFNRGLIGIYHDWCESFNTYPRTYDLLHSSFLFGSLTKRCDLVDVVIEMDRILRPGRWVLIQDTKKMIKKLNFMLKTLHWDTTIHKGTFLVGKKGFWRPST